MIDNYIYVIVALLPLAAFMLVFQVNPYYALVLRGILGAVAALIYAILGAADVALTEALVGTMLAITLYVVAVRSSLVMRLGVLKEFETEQEDYLAEIIANLRKVINKHHLRLELIEYPNSQALERALMAKEVHATCIKREPLESDSDSTYKTSIRIRRLFEIMQTELTSPETTLTYITVSNGEKKH
jgi:putative multicomponent Na+:H+ antiporter subunit B